MIPVEAVTRDSCSREIRLEFCDRKSGADGRAGGVYDLPVAEQERLLLPGHLPGWGDFLPDFAIVLGTGEPTPDGGVRWTDLRVHVGGLQWSALRAGYAPGTPGQGPLASCEWWHATELTAGRYNHPPAPEWLLDLIRHRTPWAFLIDGDSPTPAEEMLSPRDRFIAAYSGARLALRDQDPKAVLYDEAAAVFDHVVADMLAEEGARAARHEPAPPPQRRRA